MTSQKMMCPSCVGHGKFADDSVCETCKGTGQVTVAAGKKYISDNQADAPATTAHPRRAAASASKGSKKRAKKAGNVSKRAADQKATASVVTE